LGKPGNAGQRQPRALVVDDAAEQLGLVSGLLSKEGFDVRGASEGEEALRVARTHEPDLIVLDLSLPGIDGVEVCRRLRVFSDAYVIMLTSRTEEIDLLVGLSVGADDYITKPFSPRELTARVRTLLRRPRDQGRSSRVRQFGELEVDADARTVRVGGREVELTRIEFDLLDALTERPRLTYQRSVLLERVWGPNWFGDAHIVEVHMANLRAKLGDDPRRPRYIKTVRGIGYRMVDAGSTA
jgi:DNA-binding response OmpR family regulator